MMLDYLDFGEMDLWQHNGGTETLRSYRKGTDVVIPPEHVEFMRSTVMFFNSDHYFFVHAGARPDQSISWNVEHGSASIFLWAREHLSAPKTQWEKTVVCGHTPIPHPILRPDLIAIDTGCVFVGRRGLGLLTAIELPSQALTQTPYVG
jgi:serine/threonine protein phosphatase 1